MRADQSDLPELSNIRAVVINWRDPEHHLAGGSERYAWEFAVGLRNAGAAVEFLTSRDRGQSRRSVIDGIAIRRAGGRFTLYPWTLLLLLLRRRRVDVVVDVENGIPSFAPLVLRRRTPVLLVMHHVHLDQFGSHFPAAIAWVGRLLEGRAMPVVYGRAEVVTISHSTREEMTRRLGWTGPIEVVFNGTDLPRDVPRRAEPRRVAVLGRLVAHKRVDRVVRAAAALRDRGRPIRVDVIGRGPSEASLRTLVAQLGLQDHVELHGFVDEATKAELLSRAQLHVCASEGEGWGLVVLEAAAVGVPTVAYEVPGLRDSILDGRTGWLLEQGATLDQSLDRALGELEQAASAETMAAECQAWARQFTWDTMRTRGAQVVAALVGR